MARGRFFESSDGAEAYARSLVEAPASAGVVIKEDGLAGGKGVTVCDTIEQAAAAIRRAEARLTSIVVEERLVGREASVIAICDGETAIALPAARDHKRLLDEDAGPNTGGMGAYSPLADLPDAVLGDILDRFHRPVLHELSRRGSPFRGALYAGLILTPDGPKLLEFNARFGDPETQVIMPRLGVALGPLLLAAAKGDLRDARRRLGVDGSRVPTMPGASVGIVLAGGGYPEQASVGERIEGIDEARATGTLVFHSGTRRTSDGAWETNGGRVLTVVGSGADVARARDAADAAADLIHWPGARRRTDIGADLAGVLR
jgi:phosphoribosylamine--glycine ligase